MVFKSTREVERELSISPARIEFAYRSGLQRPDKILGRYAYTEADIERLRAWFAGRKPWKNQAELFKQGEGR